MLIQVLAHEVEPVLHERPLPLRLGLPLPVVALPPEPLARLGLAGLPLTLCGRLALGLLLLPAFDFFMPPLLVAGPGRLTLRLEGGAVHAGDGSAGEGPPLEEEQGLGQSGQRGLGRRPGRARRRRGELGVRLDDLTDDLSHELRAPAAALLLSLPLELHHLFQVVPGLGVPLPLKALELKSRSLKPHPVLGGLYRVALERGPAPS